ncbi:MAG TPA: NADH-quinone oxidoreductase subunit J [Deltaproteobacteria bacterium]|nr:NADH-quinone oxidoreductase subunit J [Deltaproteobacteria bacterium]
MELLFFIVFAALAVASALGVVLMRNPVYSAVSLIVCLLQMAALFVLLRSPFLAAVQVFIYVGAVMVLFLFVVLFLDVGKESRSVYIHATGPWAVLGYAGYAALTAFLIGYVALRGRLSVAPGGYDEQALLENTEVMGRLLYTKYIFPFEVVSLLLLVALVGGVVLAMKEREKA